MHQKRRHSTLRLWEIALIRSSISLKDGPDKEAKDESGEKPFHIAILQGYREMFEFLFELEVNKESHLWPHRTLLHLAVKRNDEAITKHLIKENAGLESVDSMGLTPLQDAVGAGHEVNQVPHRCWG